MLKYVKIIWNQEPDILNDQIYIFFYLYEYLLAW